MIDPPVWSREHLEKASREAESIFREARYKEPIEVYLQQFDEHRGIVEEVFRKTEDLARLEDHALELLSDKRHLEVLRYLTGPPVSEDDLKVLTGTRSLSATALRSEPQLISKVTAFLRDWHDQRRFPWLRQEERPEEYERNAAILATTTLIAMRRTADTPKKRREKEAGALGGPESPTSGLQESRDTQDQDAWGRSATWSLLPRDDAGNPQSRLRHRTLGRACNGLGVQSLQQRHELSQTTQQ